MYFRKSSGLVACANPSYKIRGILSDPEHVTWRTLVLAFALLFFRLFAVDMRRVASAG